MFAPIKRIWINWFNQQEFFIFTLLLVVIVFLSLTTSTFLTANNLQNVARNFAWIAIPAFGESMVIIIGGIDLSVGAVMALAGLVSALGMRFGLPVPIAVLAGVASGCFVGWVNGSLIGRIRFPAFVVTLGMMSIIRGLIYGLAGGWPVLDLPSSFTTLGQQNLTIGTAAFPIPMLIMLLTAITLALLMKTTALGRYIFVLGDSEQALTVTGIQSAQVKIVVYTLCGCLTGIGGILMTARLGVAAPTAAGGYELDIIAAAVIGGTSLFGGEGSILGVLLGAAFMQILRNGLVLLGFPAYWQSAAIGSMILLALLLDYWRQRRATT
jgi:ribose transport system permease protein